MATFENDLDLRGKVRLLNALLQTDTINPTLIASKESAIYFNTTDENIRLNVDGTNWYNTLVYKQPVSTYTALPVISANKLGYVTPLANSSNSKFVYLDSNGQPALQRYVDFNWIDPTIITDNVSQVINGGTRLVDADILYNYVTTAISTATGSYLPLAGGTMAGNIGMSTNKKVTFYGTDSYIYGYDADTLQLNGKVTTIFSVGGINELSLTSAALSPATDNGLALGTSSYKYSTAYIATIYTTVIRSLPSFNLNFVSTPPYTINFSTGTTSIIISATSVATAITNTMTLGTSSFYWTNTYTTTLTTNSIVLSGATGLTSVATAITSISHPTTAIPTADAVWNLFDSIDPFNTTADSYGTVATNTALANKDLYYLRGDNTWQSLIWDLTGTTVTLKSGIAATVFNVAATNTIAFKVRGTNYLIQGSYDGADVTLYLGEIGPSLATQRYYPIEVVSDLRTRSSILFGGTLATAAVIELEKGSDISGTPVLTVGSSLLQCGGITTNGTNVWSFGAAVDMMIDAQNTGYVEITIDGVTYPVAIADYT